MSDWLFLTGHTIPIGYLTMKSIRLIEIIDGPYTSQDPRSSVGLAEVDLRIAGSGGALEKARVFGRATLIGR